MALARGFVNRRQRPAIPHPGKVDPPGAARMPHQCDAILTTPARHVGPDSRRQLRPLEVGEQKRQRAVEDRGRVTVRSRVPQQVLDLPQLVVRVAGHGELHLEAFGRERRHLRRGGGGGDADNTGRSSRESGLWIPAPWERLVGSAPKACAPSRQPAVEDGAAPRCARRRACSCDEHRQPDHRTLQKSGKPPLSRRREAQSEAGICHLWA